MCLKMCLQLPLLVFFVLKLIDATYTPSQKRPCQSVYGQEPCHFVPAPPGKVPPCARPGQTYCEYPDQYPGQVINYLVQQWRYDHTTLISDESKEDFTKYFYPPPKYDYKYPTVAEGGDSYFPQPSFTSSDEFSPFTSPQQSRNFSKHFFQHLPNGEYQTYRYTDHISDGKGDNRGGTKIWNRNDNLRARLKRAAQTDRYLRNMRYNFLSSNDTGTHARRKRQVGGDRTLCETRSQFIMPRAALNKEGNWMYVVNMEETSQKYTQLVKSETCATQQCSSLCGLPAGYTSRCEQKYIQKRLVALEGTGGQLYTDLFWLPSCCLCTLSNRN